MEDQQTVHIPKEQREQIERSLRGLFKTGNSHTHNEPGPRYAWFTREAKLPQHVKVDNFDATMGKTENLRDFWITSEGYIGRFGVDLFETRREAAQAALPALEVEEQLAQARIGFLKDHRALLEEYAAGDE